MGKAFIIPDVHLKPWMFREADKYIERDKYDHIVCLGDIVDDWGCEYKLDLYKETLDTLVEFSERHPNMLFCYGNHDKSYIWELLESGYSAPARYTVLEGFSKLEKVLPQENLKFIHRIDNILFSHAGLLDIFVRYVANDLYDNVDDVLNKINNLKGDIMWDDTSPVWARPQEGNIFPLYKNNEFYQVVGHTPVHYPLEEGNLLSLDTFSTYNDGVPIGNGAFVWIDTVTHKWEYVKLK